MSCLVLSTSEQILVCTRQKQHSPSVNGWTTTFFTTLSYSPHRTVPYHTVPYRTPHKRTTRDNTSRHSNRRRWCDSLPWVEAPLTAPSPEGRPTYPSPCMRGGTLSPPLSHGESSLLSIVRPLRVRHLHLHHLLRRGAVTFVLPREPCLALALALALAPVPGRVAMCRWRRGWGGVVVKGEGTGNGKGRRP